MDKTAIIYDADYTLIDRCHPDILFDARGLDKRIFWSEVLRRQTIERDKGEIHTDGIYISLLLHWIRNGPLKGLTLREIRERGEDIESVLYPGLPDFFTSVREDNPDYDISHNIVSVGIKPMIESSVLGVHMDMIFGYDFFDDLTEGEEIDGIKTTTSSSEKISSIIEVCRRIFDEPYESALKNVIYIGDGQTDIEAFRFVNRRRGRTICVYDPHRPKARERASDIQRETEAVDYIAQADYSRGMPIERIVNRFIKYMS